MPTNGPSVIQCSACRRLFSRRSNRGRRPRFCSPSCRSTAYRARTTRTTLRADTPPEHEQAAVRIAEDIVLRARKLSRSARSVSARSPMELVNLALAMKRDVEDLLAAAVRQARDHGARWEAIGLVTHMTADSARGHWSNDQVARVLEQRQRREAGPAPTVPPSTAGRSARSPRRRPAPRRTPTAGADRDEPAAARPTADRGCLRSPDPPRAPVHRPPSVQGVPV